MAKNILLICLEKDTDETDKNFREIIKKLRRVTNKIFTCNNADQCFAFIEEVGHEPKIYLIISGIFEDGIVQKFHSIPSIQAIFILSETDSMDPNLSVNNYSKLQGIFTSINPIYEMLKKVAKAQEQELLWFSCISETDAIHSKTWTQLDFTFMYSKILMDILLKMKFEKYHSEEFFNYCREIFSSEDKELDKIKRMQQRYEKKRPIWCYKNEYLINQMLSFALRTLNFERTMKMAFFINNLYHDIEQMHKEEYKTQKASQIFEVYCSHIMAKSTFDEMQKCVRGFISFNNFFVVSKTITKQIELLNLTTINSDHHGVIFVILIDFERVTTPFANISETKRTVDEGEILFPMHTVFEINKIAPMSGHPNYTRVDLTLTDGNDVQLKEINDSIKRDTLSDGDGWFQLGLFLIKMKEFDKAYDLYQLLNKETVNEKTKATIYYRIGQIESEQGKHKEAIQFYLKAVEIQKELFSPRHLVIAQTYNDIGLSHYETNSYTEALVYYENALTIREQLLPPNHLDIAKLYNNIGNVYGELKDYSKALSFHKKALEIRQNALSSDQSSLCTSLKNIGLIYYNMGKFSKALLSFEKVLEICKQSKLSNNTDLSTIYNSIGHVYNKMNDYPKAISFYESALEIRTQSLVPDHVDLAPIYNNLGFTYENTCNFEKARSHYKRALDIGRKSLPIDHPHLLIYENNVNRLKP